MGAFGINFLPPAPEVTPVAETVAPTAEAPAVEAVDLAEEEPAAEQVAEQAEVSAETRARLLELKRELLTGGSVTFDTELGEYQVADLGGESLPREYIARVIGRADSTPFSESRERSTDFYTEKVKTPAQRIKAIFTATPPNFGTDTQALIQAKMPIIEKLAADDAAFTNNSEFQSFLDTNSISHADVYGGDGVLNLLLAFNRAIGVAGEGVPLIDLELNSSRRGVEVQRISVDPPAETAPLEAAPPVEPAEPVTPIDAPTTIEPVEPAIPAGEVPATDADEGAA